jgi:hypothetical protein
MDLTDDERDLILAGLFELTITYAEDDEKREEFPIERDPVAAAPEIRRAVACAS